MSYLLNHIGPVNAARLRLRQGVNTGTVLLQLLEDLVEMEKREQEDEEEFEESVRDVPCDGMDSYGSLE